MSITFTPSVNGVTLDETGGLQFNGSPDDTAGATDNDDSDVSLATLLSQRPNLYNFLFTTLALSTSFSNADGVAHGTIGTATSNIPISAINFSFTDGAFSGLFTDNGTKLFLYSSALFPNLVLLREADGSNNPNPNGTIAAAINLDVSVDGTSTSEDVNVWIVQFEALKEPNTSNPDDTVTLANLSLSVATSLSFSFAGAPSGQNYFMLFGSQSAALLVSGANPVDDTTNTNISTGDTVNTSQGGGATTLGVNNQMVDPGEGMHFRFVTLATTDFLVPNLDQNEADVEANTAANGFVNSTGASVHFVQTQPGGGSGQYFTVSLTAYSADKSAALETGTHYAEELDNDTKVNILSTGVQVLRGGVNVAGTDPPGSAPPVNVSVVNGVLTVSGLKAGDELAYTTSGTHNHVFVQAVSGAAFDIGGFSILSSETAPFAINNIHFDDAAPTAHVSDGGGTVTIDETAGLQNDDTTAPAALALFDTEVVNKSTDLSPAQFAISTTPLVSTSGSVGGADGIQSTALSLAIVGGDGTDSLLDTTDGKNILLFKEGDLIVGRYDIANGTVDQTDPAAFAIAINQDGNAAVVLYASLHHPDATNPDDQVDLTGLVNVVATVTDGDGDKSTATFGIGDKLNFDDDGPTAAVSDGGGAVTVDETAGLQNNDTSAAAVLALFGTVVNKSLDLPTAQFAVSTTPLVSTSGSDGGADGIQSTVLSLAVNGGNGTDSLLDTTDGKNILLFKEGDLIVGRYDVNNGTVTQADPAAFAIAIEQDGNAAIALYASLHHPDATNPDDQIDLTGKINVVATVTDGDGDKSTASFGIGDKLNFDDDGPTLSAIPNSTNSLVYANGTTETKSFTFDAGADNESASVALTDFTDPDNAADLAASHLGALETLMGVNITATQVGNTVTYYTPDGPDAGTAPDPLFQLSLTNSAWTFTILQDRPLVFNAFDFSTVAAGGPVETIALEATNSNTFGVFNGFLFGPIDAADGTESRGIYPPNPIDLPGTSGANTADDLNPDSLGFGVKGGAASNMNNNEGFSVTFHDGSAGGPLKSVEGLSFKMQQQGNTDDVVLSFDLINGTQGGGNDPDIVAIEKGASINLIGNQNLAVVDDGHFWLRLGLPTGNKDIKFTILSDDFQSAYTPAANEIVVYAKGDYQTDFFRMAYPDNGTFDQYPTQVGDSVRIKDVTLIETLPVPDVTLAFSAQGVDGDGDHTSVQSFNVFISDDGLAIV